MYINDMAQAVKCDFYLYADDSCLVYISKDMHAIEDTLNKNFNSLCDWFVENKLRIHFGEDKTKSIIFGSKKMLDIQRVEILIKQHKRKLNIFDCNTSGETIGCKSIK